MAALRRRSARAPVVGRRCVAFLRTGAGINWQTRPGRLDWRKLCAENCAPMNALIFSNLALMLVSYSPLASGGPRVFAGKRVQNLRAARAHLVL